MAPDKQELIFQTCPYPEFSKPPLKQGGCCSNWELPPNRVLPGHPFGGHRLRGRICRWCLAIDCLVRAKSEGLGRAVSNAAGAALLRCRGAGATGLLVGGGGVVCGGRGEGGGSFVNQTVCAVGNLYGDFGNGSLDFVMHTGIQPIVGVQIGLLVLKRK